MLFPLQLFKVDGRGRCEFAITLTDQTVIPVSSEQDARNRWSAENKTRRIKPESLSRYRGTAEPLRSQMKTVPTANPLHTNPCLVHAKNQS